MSINTDTLRNVTRLNATTDFSPNRIAEILRISSNTVRNYIKRTQSASCSWDDVQKMDDVQLHEKFSRVRKCNRNKVLPDFESIHKRMLKNKLLTLDILHQEYAEEYRGRAYKYSHFANLFRQYLNKLDPTMRLIRYPGELIQVDFCGPTIPWEEDGVTHNAQIFVGVLGVSSYTYVVALRSQKLADFIHAHIKMFEYFGGVSECVVPDNLKSAITNSCRKNIIVNPTYLEMAEHYGYVVAPARPKKPRDKGLGEQAVRFVEIHILSHLRERKFNSLEEINDAIKELLAALNNRKMQVHEGTRLSRFNELEKLALKPLREEPYEFAEWLVSLKVPNDYHLVVQGHSYSVPYHLVGEKVDVRISQNVVELFSKKRRVATHERQHDKGGFSTNQSHMPKNHLAYANDGLEMNIEWASKIGPKTEEIIRLQYSGKRSKSIAENRACSDLKELARVHGDEDFEAACNRAVSRCSTSAKSIKSILKHKLFNLDVDTTDQLELPLHNNVRGANYYQGGVAQ